jgi:hypothetical protein
MRAVTEDAFTQALERVRNVALRPEFTLQEAPAPKRLAPDAVALVAEAIDDEETDGRFVLLHDPDGHDEWGGAFRVVVFTRSCVDEDVALDPLLPEVAWSWVQEALDECGATAEALGGTVSTNMGRSFGTLHDRPGDRVLEVRASWTPTASDGDSVADTLDRHVRAWITLLAQVGGLPNIGDDVTPLPTRRT